MLTTVQKVATGIAALFYIFAGTLHFVSPGPYIRIVPPWIPWHAGVVAVSGAAEIAGGAGLLIPRLRRVAAWGLVALLIAVFPANLYMATNQVPLGSVPLSPMIAWGRLPVQLLLIWWVLWATRSVRPQHTV